MKAGRGLGVGNVGGGARKKITHVLDALTTRDSRHRKTTHKRGKSGTADFLRPYEHAPSQFYGPVTIADA